MLFEIIVFFGFFLEDFNIYFKCIYMIVEEFMVIVIDEVLLFESEENV